MAKPVTKYSVMIDKPEWIRYEIEKALCVSQDGRPGPILLDIPIDIQKIQVDPEKLIGFNNNVYKSNFNYELVNKQIDKFLKQLHTSKRPVFMIGGGARISGATELIREISSKLKIPSYPTWNATDVITSDFEYYGGRIGTYGGAGRNLGIQNADLLPAIGSRIPGRVTGGNLKSFAREAIKYVVDIDESMLQ